MATQTVIQGSDIIKSTRAVLNANFAALNTAKVEGATALTTEGAIPWVSAAGVVTSDHTKLRIDPTTGVVTIPAGLDGNAATATRLATARTIAGVSFDGSANIAIASTNLSDTAGLVRGAAAVAAGGVPYATAAGVLGTDAGFVYDPAKRGLSLAYPVDVYDNFSGTAGAALSGRMPAVGPYAWLSSGTGAANAYAGNGVMGVSSNDNTYFIARGSTAPYEIVATMRNSAGSPSSTISIVKDYATWTFGAMWHVTFSSSGINHLYWNLIANGGAADVASVAPTSQLNSATLPTLSANTEYVCRLTINGNYSDASIETTDGVVLYRSRAYDPIIPSLMGPWVYVQSGSTTNVYTSFKMTTRPPKPSFDYGRFGSGIDGTPIGSILPSPGSFSSVTVGGTKQGGIFQVNHGSTAALFPRIVGNGTGGVFIIESDTAGFASRLEIKNGFGGIGKIEMTGAYDFQFSGNSGTPFLTKAVNAGNPYFASNVGFNAATGQAVGYSAAGILEVNNGTTGTFRDLRVRDLYQNGTANRAVFGGEALTTVGWIPYVTSAGVLGGEANLFWDATNDRLGVGTNAPTTNLDIATNSASNNGIRIVNASTGSTEAQFRNSVFGANAVSVGIDSAGGYIYSGGTIPLRIFAGGSERGRFNPTTGNLLIGTPADGNFKFDVGASGSAGTARIYDQTATTGTTCLVVRAGAGQTGRLVIYQNAGGTAISGVGASGAPIVPVDLWLYDNVNAERMYFQSGSSTFIRGSGGSPVVLRNASDVTIATFSSTGTLILPSTIVTSTATPASASATGVTGTWAWDADYVYVCTATNTWKRAAIATW